MSWHPDPSWIIRVKIGSFRDIPLKLWYWHHFVEGDFTHVHKNLGWICMCVNTMSADNQSRRPSIGSLNSEVLQKNHLLHNVRAIKLKIALLSIRSNEKVIFLCKLRWTSDTAQKNESRNSSVSDDVIMSSSQFDSAGDTSGSIHSMWFKKNLRDQPVTVFRDVWTGTVQWQFAECLPRQKMLPTCLAGNVGLFPQVQVLVF